MHYLIILHYFIIYLGETLRSLHTVIELHNSNYAHGVYNIGVCIIH
jgi:hypothetical protein